jgi:dTDP-4-dehydrorhamnose 3,5-epimerase
MKFIATPLPGAFVIELEHHSDNRGFFARAFCQKEFEAHGLVPNVAQCNFALSAKAGTIRGLHYQAPPATEAKLFRCITGAMYDVIVDMRPESPTYLQHFGIELSAANRRTVYVPDMFAHGYQALKDGTEVLYQVSEFYTPGVEQGLRYDDPSLKIEWPIPATVVSEKDQTWPLLAPVSVGAK